MTDATNTHPEAHTTGKRRASVPDLKDYPIREYVAAMSAELAQMARWDGDERLACVLDTAATMALKPR